MQRIIPFFPTKEYNTQRLIIKESGTGLIELERDVHLSGRDWRISVLLMVVLPIVSCLDPSNDIAPCKNVTAHTTHQQHFDWEMSLMLFSSITAISSSFISFVVRCVEICKDRDLSSGFVRVKESINTVKICVYSWRQSLGEKKKENCCNFTCIIKEEEGSLIKPMKSIGCDKSLPCREPLHVFQPESSSYPAL